MLSIQRSWAVLLVASLAVIGGCSDGDGEKYCGTDLNTRIEATIAAAQALEISANNLAASVAAACANIAIDLDGEVEDPHDVEIACAAADRAIAGALEGGVRISIVASPPVCTFDAKAQLDCEAGCVIEGGCEPGSIETRCEPGHFSVQCEGFCEAEASVICEAEAHAWIECEGSCSGLCDGSCGGVCEGECEGTLHESGHCEGTCLGTCSGSCEGYCQGSCEYGADATAKCEGDAHLRCRGGCEGSASLPRCETQLTPPSCEVEAECQASCEAEASFKSECEPGYVHIVVESGDAADKLIETLEGNLPTLLAVEAYANLWGNVEAFADGIVDLSGALQDNLLCLGARASALANAVTRAANAAVTVSVTVEFSACASASTSSDGTPACQ